jgi:hypothetical protein
MAYEISWQLEGRVVVLHAWDIVTVTEAVELSEKIADAFQQGSPPTHLIVQMDDLQISPSGIQTNLRLASYLKHPHLGWVVTIGGTPLTQFISNIVHQFFRFKLHQAESLATALDFLRNQDSSLEALI